ncbi:MAG: hypothetical protein CMN80_00950 [Spongiibacter sp.]|uniref:hypothetical protein n=1 Tax=uncultured Spongiibacter sp. TaxID=870896 RepID=UPI000C0B3461|nr:hypothetical protein [Spongiibacter sp.]|tara:strand:- start:1408 stop:1842 length:435 start_codon:yes stop_codon:yes gene_type:complete
MIRSPLFFLILLIATHTNAKDWSHQVNKDFVTVTPSSMTYTDRSLCTGPKGSIQVLAEYTTPKKSGVSRDFLIMVGVTLSSQFVNKLVDGVEDKASCKTIDSTIGNPDIQISATLTSTGIQTTVKNASGEINSSHTSLWSNFPM